MTKQAFPLLILIASAGLVAQTPNFAGDFAGTSGPLHVTLHLVSTPDGKLTGTVDSPDQGISGMPCSNIHTDGQALSFSVPMVHGTWTGFISTDSNSLSGMWNQGNASQLNLTRVSAGVGGGAANQPAGPRDVAVG